MLEKGLWQSAVELQEYLESSRLSFCFIGGVVLQRWGEPRVTLDVDVTIVVPFGEEKASAIEILKRYQSRIDDPISFATQARILLLLDLHGNKIDLSIGGMPFEERTIYSLAGSRLRANSNLQRRRSGRA